MEAKIESSPPELQAVDMSISGIAILPKQPPMPEARITIPMLAYYLVGQVSLIHGIQTDPCAQSATEALRREGAVR